MKLSRPIIVFIFLSVILMLANVNAEILTSDINVDGLTQDWENIPIYLADAIGDVSLNGADVEYLKFSYKQDYSILYGLIKLVGPPTSSFLYRIFFEHLSGEESYQMDVQFINDEWDLISQTLSVTDDDNFNVINENGIVFVNANYIEFQLNSSAFNLPENIAISGWSANSQTYDSIDNFDRDNSNDNGDSISSNAKNTRYNVEIFDPESKSAHVQIEINEFSAEFVNLRIQIEPPANPVSNISVRNSLITMYMELPGYRLIMNS